MCNRTRRGGGGHARTRTHATVCHTHSLSYTVYGIHSVVQYRAILYIHNNTTPLVATPATGVCFCRTEPVSKRHRCVQQVVVKHTHTGRSVALLCNGVMSMPGLAVYAGAAGAILHVCPDGNADQLSVAKLSRHERNVRAIAHP